MSIRSPAGALCGAVTLALACGAGAFSPARADTIRITSDGAAYGYDTVYLNDSQFNFPNGSGSVDVYSGADLIKGTDTTTSSPFSQVVFCTDVHNFLTSTPYTFTQGELSDTVSDPTKIGQINTLIGNGTALLAGLGSNLYQGAYTATEVSSALQIAVWTAEYQTVDTGYNATDSADGFWVSNPSNQADVTLANAFLSDVTDGTWSSTGTLVQLEATDPANNQDLSYTDPTRTQTPVPEPASLALLGMGLAGLVAARRRRAAG